MISNLFSAITGLSSSVFLWVIAGLLILLGVQQLRVEHAKTEAANAVSSMNQYKADYEKAFRESETARAQLNEYRTLAAAKVDSDVAREKEARAAERAPTGVVTRARGVSEHAIAVATAPSGATGCDSTAVARAEQTAALLGNLLTQAYREADGDVQELEELATQVRGLQARYNSLIKAPDRQAEASPVEEVASAESVPAPVLDLALVVEQTSTSELHAHSPMPDRPAEE